MEARQSALLFTGVLAALGHIGAGLSYGYLIGLDTQNPFTCPVCAHVLSSGDPVNKFIVRTVILGTLNALVLVTVGWCIRGLVMLAKKVIRH